MVATTGEKSKGLQLSRLKDQWIVGVVQQWWLRREALRAPKANADLLERYRYERALELYMISSCVGEFRCAADAASAPKVEPKK